jgi:hypothetical protein
MMMKCLWLPRAAVQAPFWGGRIILLDRARASPSSAPSFYLGPMLPAGVAHNLGQRACSARLHLTDHRQGVPRVPLGLGHPRLDPEPPRLVEVGAVAQR